MSMKLVITGIVLIAAVVLGFWFWQQFTENQNNLSDTPMDNPTNPGPSADNSVNGASLDAELTNTDPSGLDTELDLSGL